MKYLTKRNCLTCGVEFQSEGSQNRICRGCKGREVFRYPSPEKEISLHKTQTKHRQAGQ